MNVRLAAAQSMRAGGRPVGWLGLAKEAFYLFGALA